MKKGSPIHKNKSHKQRTIVHSLPNWMYNTRVCASILIIFSFLLYANTLGHEYTQDDAIVITENMYTQQGISGIPGILSKDTFFGFFKEEGKAQLVSGGRYRPLTLIMFAVELSLFGDSPFIGHLFNVIWFGLSVCLIYFLMLLILKQYPKDQAFLISFATAALFAAHPIHTEAVANIKGRDEIMTLLLSLGALFLYIKNIDSGKWIYLFGASVSLFLGLLAKENAITFLAIIPITAWFFRGKLWHRPLPALMVLIIPTFIFLWLRTTVIGQLLGGDPPRELMNNPFLKFENGQYIPFSFSEKYATITYTLGKYVQLLLWPHPLTHDYYPRQIGILQWTHPGVLASLFIYLGLGIYALKQLSKKHIFSYSFFYFVITLSIVSNLVFPVGTNMSERFLFMPSLGFSIWLSYWLSSQVWGKGYKKIFIGIYALLLIGYSYKTVDRNSVWQSNASLFLNDVNISVNSAKLQNAAGGEKTRLATLELDDNKKNQLLKEAIIHLQRAVEIHPTYKNAYLLLGNASYYLQNYQEAIQYYEQALRLDPNYKDALTNIGIAYRDGGRYFGEQKGDLQQALQYLTNAIRYLPQDYETNRLLGVAMGLSGQSMEAVGYFEKATQLSPDNADAWMNLSTAFKAVGRIKDGEEALNRAVSIDPEVANRNASQR